MKSLRAFAQSVARAIAAVIGAPDYERYLERLGAGGPGAAPLSRGELLLARQRARLERPGSRCC
jgi:uncharacterized short protein YbdD (DUF466 family)